MNVFCPSHIFFISIIVKIKYNINSQNKGEILIMKLTKRLQYLVDAIPNDANIIDVAADHGYVALALAKKNANRQIIVNDIAYQPLQVAKKNFQTANFVADFRLGSGLTVLTDNDEIDTVIIAGIGGKLLVEILEESSDKLKNISTLCLQANIGMALVRKWLYMNKYTVIDDILIDENKHIYECIIAKKAQKLDCGYPLDEKSREIIYHFGKFITQNDPTTLKNWLSNKIIMSDKVLTQLAQTDYNHVKAKIEFHQKIIEYAKGILI